ncbi:aminotransferase class I/II-fold pyridoxal phosphate-dependent enzyme [soil metagenome]
MHAQPIADKQDLKLDHNQAPMVAHIRELRDRGVSPYLSIGHKVGAAVDPELLELLGRDFFASNTWITGDAFHEALHESELLAANAWGSQQSFYLVDGSSSGNHAFLLGTLRPGDEVVVSRDLHWSLLVALIITGARPIYVAPRLDPLYDIGRGLDPDDVETALREHPNTKLVIVVSPSFCGVSSDLMGIAEIAHRHGVPLYVDEAWGPHFHFHERLPMSAIASGADAAVSSIHKILPAVSQGSILHLQGNLLDRERILTAVKMMQTTSPLLPIIATLDGARRQMALAGHEHLDRVIALSEWAKQEIAAIPGIEVIGAAALGLDEQRADITKFVLDVHGLGLTGFEVEQRLNDEYEIALELSDHRGIIGNFNLGDSQETAERFVSALRGIAANASPERNMNGALRSSGAAVAVTVLAMTPRDAYFAPSRSIDLAESVGLIAAELVTPYPPGIPVLAPGDLITQEKVEYLLATSEYGRGNYGARGAAPAQIKVVDLP